jgi:hypothetical protein
VRLIGCLAKATSAVLLVFAVRAGKPDNARFILECQDMGRNPIKEPAIMGNDQRASGEIDEGVFERAQGVDIEIVGWLIE